jgi:NAD(P)-dependent dehydrogenase (short-subunit alcohol dehydrogenase family)
LEGKICLITGATAGIGKETARGLAKLGATLVLAGRSPQKTETVAREIEAGGKGGKVDWLVADLSSMEEVRRAAQEFRQRHDRLDVLINNAGAIYMNRQESVDGLEKTFALNHLSYFLLTNLLLDIFKASTPARIVNVSSGANFSGRVKFDDLQLKKGYSGWRAYSQSKLMNVLFTYELARRLEGSAVTANVLHPGFVATNFGRSNGGLFNWIFRLAQVTALTPEKGAETSIYLASSPEVEGISGKYYDNKRTVHSAAASYDQDAAKRLWEISLALTG